MTSEKQKKELAEYNKKRKQLVKDYDKLVLAKKFAKSTKTVSK